MLVLSNCATLQKNNVYTLWANGSVQHINTFLTPQPKNRFHLQNYVQNLKYIKKHNIAIYTSSYMKTVQKKTKILLDAGAASLFRGWVL